MEVGTRRAGVGISQGVYESTRNRKIASMYVPFSCVPIGLGLPEKGSAGTGTGGSEATVGRGAAGTGDG